MLVTSGKNCNMPDFGAPFGQQTNPGQFANMKDTAVPISPQEFDVMQNPQIQQNTPAIQHQQYQQPTDKPVQNAELPESSLVDAMQNVALDSRRPQPPAIPDLSQIDDGLLMAEMERRIQAQQATTPQPQTAAAYTVPPAPPTMPAIPITNAATEGPGIEVESNLPPGHSWADVDMREKIASNPLASMLAVSSYREGGDVYVFVDGPDSSSLDGLTASNMAFAHRNSPGVSMPNAGIEKVAGPFSPTATELIAIPSQLVDNSTPMRSVWKLNATIRRSF